MRDTNNIIRAALSKAGIDEKDCKILKQSQSILVMGKNTYVILIDDSKDEGTSRRYAYRLYDTYDNMLVQSEVRVFDEGSEKDWEEVQASGCGGCEGKCDTCPQYHNGCEGCHKK